MKDLESKNLIMRRFKLEDLDDQFEVVSNEDVAKMSDFHPEEREETLLNIKSAIRDYDTYEACWAIEEKESNKVIGHIRIKHCSLESKTCTLLWAVGKNYWNKGYSEEALKEVIKFLFKEHPFEIIIVEYYSSNIYWQSILEKVGFKKDATLRRRKINPVTNEKEDLIIYSILKEEVNF